MLRKSAVFLLLLPFLAAAGTANEKLLVPISIGGSVAGAFGSRWTSVLTGYNSSDHFIRVVDAPFPCAITCPREPADPKSAFTVLLRNPNPGGGGFVYLLAPDTNGISLNLRVQDISRQSLTWGTELPLIRERDLFTSEVTLVNIPTDDRFRQALRIYDFDGQDSQVQLQIFQMASSTPLVDQVVTLTSKPFSVTEVPAQALITDIVGTFPQLPLNERLRITIRPLTLGLRFWTFVSITNNETQHVTTITPR